MQNISKCTRPFFTKFLELIYISYDHTQAPPLCDISVWMIILTFVCGHTMAVAVVIKWGYFHADVAIDHLHSLPWRSTTYWTIVEPFSGDYMAIIQQYILCRFGELLSSNVGDYKRSEFAKKRRWCIQMVPPPGEFYQAACTAWPVWCNGEGVGLQLDWSLVRLPAVIYCLGKLFTHVPLSTSSRPIIWYRSHGSNVLQLGR